MRGKCLTLFVPGLSGPAEALAGTRTTNCAATLDATVETIGLTRLETLLSRAVHCRAVFPHALEAQVFSLFGVSTPSNADLPVAALTHAYDSGKRDARWYVRSDPVHVQANLREVILSDASRFSLELDEAEEFVALVNTHFAAERWCMEALHPQRWYLGFDRPQAFATTPLSLVNGSSIEGCMPAGEDAPRWHSVLNEIQMLFHDCETNRRREQRGLLPVNGVWLWGGGGLASVEPAGWDYIYTDNVVAGALAHASGSRTAGLPGSFQSWCESPRGGGRRHLVILDTLFGPARLAQVEQWYAGLQQLNAQWFDDLPEALNSGAVESVEFLTPPLGRYTATRRSMARWWRRRRSFGSLVEARLRPVASLE